MIHDCQYAREIGAEPVWLVTERGEHVCSLCHMTKKTRTVEVPVTEDEKPAAPVKSVRK